MNVIREKQDVEDVQVEDATDDAKPVNLIYDDVDEDPVLSAKPYIAIAAMFVTLWVQVICLQGSPLVVRCVASFPNSSYPRWFGWVD